MNSIDLGSYLNSFFFIQIKTKENLENLSTLSPTTRSTFIHEYTHFLQDIVTVFGLRKITHQVDFIKRMAQGILNGNTLTFDVPVKIPKNDIQWTNVDLDDLYWGNYDFALPFDKIVSVDYVENEIIENFESEKIVKVKVLNSRSNKHEDFCFGAYCIRESMAHLIESELSKKNIQVPTFPYKTVEYLWEYFFPEISSNTLSLIALCDFALHSYNPALHLVEFLERMKRENIIPGSPKELIQETNKYRYFEYGQEISISASELFDSTFALARKSLTDYFTDDYFKPVINWIEILLEKAYDLRVYQGFSFIDFVKSDTDTSIDYFFKIKDSIGIPILSNDNDQFFVPQNPGNQKKPSYV